MRSMFYDTYALFEIIEGNEQYASYSHSDGLVTTRLQLMELYYGLLRKYGQDVAERFYNRLLGNAIDMPDDCIKEAMRFRFTHSVRKLSYVDCIGYIIAAQRNVPFLTGDKQFEDMPNVEFVK